MKSIKEWQIEITKLAKEKGFDWTPDDISIMLLRLHSEISEAGEALRDNDINQLAEELADLFIRLVNTCEIIGIDLEKEVELKHKYNKSRDRLHGRARK